MSIIIDTYNKKASAVPDSYGQLKESDFEFVNKFPVPFVVWKDYKDPDDYDVLRSVGYISLMKGKLDGFKIDINSRFKINGKFYHIDKILPFSSLNRIYINDVVDGLDDAKNDEVSFGENW